MRILWWAVNRPSMKPLPVWNRLVAVLGVALVLGLGAFSVNAEWHDWLHHGDHTEHAVPEHGDAGCVVMHWARGGSTALTVAPSVEPPVRFVEVLVRMGEPAVVERAISWQPPGRGPPTA